MKPSHSYFNSIKVRLEPEEPQPGETAQEFQFHKGTIRTFFECTLGYDFHNFNSIKVRLERYR